MTNAIQRLSDKYHQAKNLGECVYTLELLNTTIDAYKPSEAYNESIRAKIDEIAELLMKDFRGEQFDRDSIWGDPSKPSTMAFREIPDDEKDASVNDIHKQGVEKWKKALESSGEPSDLEPIVYGKLNKPKSTVMTINQRAYADKLRQDAIKDKFPSKLAKQLEIGRLGKICEDAGYILELEKIKSRRANGTIQDAFRLHINNATEDWNISRALSDTRVIDKLQLFINFKNL